MIGGRVLPVIHIFFTTVFFALTFSRETILDTMDGQTVMNGCSFFSQTAWPTIVFMLVYECFSLFFSLSRTDPSCSDFPLSRSFIDPLVNVFHPNKCGGLVSFAPSALRSSGCFADRTVVVVGDSRGRQVGGSLAVIMDDGRYTVEQ